ncbi:hypothetical protein U1Q18_014549 [Sarracenia purpurea var. burkii]
MRKAPSAFCPVSYEGCRSGEGATHAPNYEVSVSVQDGRGPCVSEVRIPCSSDVTFAPNYDFDVNDVEISHSLRVEGERSLWFGENSRSSEGAPKVLENLSKTTPWMNKQGVPTPKSLASDPRAASDVELGEALHPVDLEGDREKQAGEKRPESFSEAHSTRTWAKVVATPIYPKNIVGTHQRRPSPIRFYNHAITITVVDAQPVVSGNLHHSSSLFLASWPQ